MTRGANLGTRVLVVGPARSGKSSWAEDRLQGYNGVDYVATSHADPADAEWVERVRLHRNRRPAHWRTVETTDLVGVLCEDSANAVLVDCVGVWLSRMIDEAGAWERDAGARRQVTEAIEDLLGAIVHTNRTVYFVSNEVGAGIIPAEEGMRYYRDQLGVVNAQLASACDETWVCHVGICRRWDRV